MTTLDNIRIHKADRMSLPTTDKYVLSGVEVYAVGGVTEPVIHLELIVQAGRVHAAHPSLPSASASMMNEGTTSRTAKQISEEIEYFGSTVRCNAGTDAMSISLYCVSRFFEPSLAIVEDMLMNATFPERELDVYKQNKLQKLDISLQRNEYVANTQIAQQLFKGHVYGYHATREDIEQLSQEALSGHYQMVGSHNMAAFVVGRIDDKHLKTLEEMLSRLRAGTRAPRVAAPAPHVPKSSFLDGPQHLQCSIRMGRWAVSRNHPDFGGLYFLNTLFGGYFGSRLMTNIREDKGLTYHISTSLETLAEGASLILSTEASNENKDVVLEEIYAEMRSLRSELISTEECEMTRNYIMGNLMMQLDGPFRAIDVAKTLFMENIAPESFDNMINSIERITPEQLRELAREYLDLQQFDVVVVS